MRAPNPLAVILSLALLTGCNRNDPDDTSATSGVSPSAPAAMQPAPSIDTVIAPAPAVAKDPAEEPIPPAPVVEGMYVIYACDDGTQPRITFAGNLVKVELTAESEPVVLSARASASNMSDTYSDDTLTLYRDGLGITLDPGGKRTRCTESQASA